MFLCSERIEEEQTRKIFKGTGSQDGLDNCIDLGLKMDRGWFMHFLEAPMSFHLHNVFLSVKANNSWNYNVSDLFFPVPTDHRWSTIDLC